MDNKVKVIVASLCFGAAVLVVLWQVGVFSGSPAPPEDNGQDNQAIQEAINNAPANQPVRIDGQDGGRGGAPSGPVDVPPRQ